MNTSKNTTTLHTRMMQKAFQLAKKAAEADEVPVGAVVYGEDGTLWGEGYNLTIANKDPSAHAEIVAMREAGQKYGSHNLTNLYLATTLEPCAMCAQAIAWARIKEVHYAATDPKSGGVLHGAKVFNHATCHHKPKIVEGPLAEESRNLLQSFFKAKRK